VINNNIAKVNIVAELHNRGIPHSLLIVPYFIIAFLLLPVGLCAKIFLEIKKPIGDRQLFLLVLFRDSKI